MRCKLNTARSDWVANSTMMHRTSSGMRSSPHGVQFSDIKLRRSDAKKNKWFEHLTKPFLSVFWLFTQKTSKINYRANKK
jgi:hypothetical protein